MAALLLVKRAVEQHCLPSPLSLNLLHKGLVSDISLDL